MRVLLVILFSFCVAGCGSGGNASVTPVAPIPSASPGLHLVWSDEFNGPAGTAVDPTKCNAMLSLVFYFRAACWRIIGALDRNSRVHRRSLHRASNCRCCTTADSEQSRAYSFSSRVVV